MKNLPIDRRRLFLIAGVLFLTLVIVEFNSRLEELDRLNRQANITRAEATQAALTIRKLPCEIYSLHPPAKNNFIFIIF